jgi:hypothetical protein
MMTAARASITAREPDPATRGWEALQPIANLTWMGQLYRAARDLGNVEEAEQWPTAYGKRLMRRKVYARSNSLTRQLLKAIGMSR